jgi:spore coat protein U-like protein
MKSTIKFLAVVLVFTAVPVFAQTDTDNLEIRAEVIANCTIVATSVDFGFYDPLAAGNDTAQGQIDVTCTRGASGLRVDLSNGNHNGLGPSGAGERAMLLAGTDYLSYNLFTDNTYGTIWGSGAGTGGVNIPNSASSTVAQQFTVWGRMLPGQDAAVGVYNDTVVATINF